MKLYLKEQKIYKILNIFNNNYNYIIAQQLVTYINEINSIDYKIFRKFLV